MALAASIAVSPCLGAFAVAPPTGIPSSLLVAVGYADTERGIARFQLDFPSLWCGSPGVQFIGSSTNYNGNSTDPANCEGGDWDGGAILVTNSGAAPITLTNLTVVLPLPASGDVGSPICPDPTRPITFNLWFGQQYYFDNRSDPAYFGGPITLSQGGQAIFAGTSSDGAYKCPSGNYPAGPAGSPNATYDFDTSDTNFLTGCNPTNDTVSDPRITLTATGYASTTYVDSGHTIDDGGIDPGNCSATSANPEWPNESLGWRLVNDTCGEACQTNQFTYTPPATLSSSPSASTSEFSIGTTSNRPGGAAATEASLAILVVAVAVGGLYLLTRRTRSSG